ncbi:TRAP transporter substrate-binding protein [Consotaella aegiceratis]|uniref:TRAP transporter substrate-binding protein n=1 Tax=Consotaella aegiceratis TaxID=3097961 RepID=UPI002F430100
MKNLAFFLATTALVAVAGSADAASVNLRFAYATNATPTKEAMTKFGELLQEKTNGEVTVTYFPDSQLGGERELVEMVQSGLLDMTKVSGGLMESFSPVYGVFSMPYLFSSEDQFYQVLDDPDIMGSVYESTKANGMVGLTYYGSGQRSFFTVNKPIMHVGDLAGLKIRVMQSPTSIKMMDVLGGSPVAMSAEEVYTSLQQGIIDGAESNEFALTVDRFGEITKTYSYDMHTRIPDIMLIGTAALDKLSDEQKQAVYEAAKESTEYQRELWAAAVQVEKTKAEDEFGVQFFYPDVAEFREAVQPMYEELKAKPEQYEIYQKIQAKAGE